MSHGHLLAHEHAVLLLHSMEHAAILHVGMRADPDGMHVAAQHRIHPDAGILAENYISDDLRRLIHIAGIRNRRHDAFVRADHSEYRKRLNITCTWGGK